MTSLLCKSCTPLKVGRTPLPNFVIGLVLIVTSFLLILWIFYSSLNISTRKRGGFRILLLPIYHSVVVYTIVVTTLVGIDNLLGISSEYLFLHVVKWSLFQFQTVGILTFLMHHGVGWRALRHSLLLGALWSLISGFILVLSFYVTSTTNNDNSSINFLIALASVSLLLLVFFLALWLIPLKVLHRRPAATRLLQISAVFYAMVLATSLANIGTDISYKSLCALQVVWALIDLVQPFVILGAVHEDSLFWQGLYNISASNLNTPLLGMWEMGNEAINMVAGSISHLQTKVVPIIPFYMLEMDGSKFFPGGSARVYRGRHLGLDGNNNNNEVAIKILFCIDLTPERVVDFCNEATLLHTLQHPNIVTCYGVGVMPPAISLVTEFCHFGSLFDFLHSFDLKRRDHPAKLLKLLASENSAAAMSHSNNGSINSNNGQVWSPGQADSNNNSAIIDDLENGGTSPLSDIARIAAEAMERSASPATKNPHHINTKDGHHRSHSNLDLSKDSKGGESIISYDSWLPYASSHGSNGSNASIHLLHQSFTQGDGDGGRRGGGGGGGGGGGSETGSKMKDAASFLISQEMYFGFGPKDAPSISVPHINGAQPHSRHRLDRLEDLSMGHLSQNRPSAGRPSRHSIGHFLPTHLRLKMCLDCCAGVAFLHSNNFTHCDIKSLNFLVNKDFVVKLSDLGEARSFSSTSSLCEQEEQHQIPVNINWASPEILGEAARVSDAADVWSLAFVISEILTGEVPFDTPEMKKTNMESYKKELENGLRPKIPKNIEEECPWLVTLLQNAWKYEPSMRCSAKEMQRIFEANIQSSSST